MIADRRRVDLEKRGLPQPREGEGEGEAIFI
jgi:hypothetical protein